MSAINQEDLLGEFIPDVFISQIVLENSGTPQVDNSNPHINASGEMKVGTITSKTEDHLSITVKMVLKEKISNDVIGNWLDKIDLQKYLRLKVLQSTDPKTTALLSLSQDMLDLVASHNISEKDVRFKTAAAVFETDSINTVLETIKQTTRFEIIQINNKKLGTKTTDDDGNEVFNINYNIKFSLNKSFPDHLAYFAVSSFDLQQLAQDFHLEYDTIDLAKMDGKVVSEVVIDDGDLVDKSYVFYDADGKVWAGAVHLLGNGKWRSKSEEESNSVDLIKDTVTNNKIQDFRNIRDIEKLQFDFSSVERKMGEIEIKSSSNDKIDPKRIEEYFSDLLLTSDTSGDTKFLFTVNYEKMITDLSIYGGLIKKGGTRFLQEMMKQTKIKQMKLIRRRVKHSSSVSRFSVNEGMQVFDQNEPYETISVSGEKEFGRFVTQNTKIGSLREVFPVLDTIEDGIRHFTGMDKTMSDVTDGYYQYCIEFDIDDGSVEFFKEKLGDLRDARSELVSYLNEASKLPLTKSDPEIQNPHIKHPKEKKGTTERLDGNFDFDSNKFTQKFIKQMTSKYSGNKLASAPWIAPIVIYADVLDMFTDAFQSLRDRKVVLNSLFTFTSPRTGNPSGIAEVIRLMDSLIYTIENLVGTSQTKSLKKSVNTSSYTTNLFSGRNFKKSIRVQKFFKTMFDSNTIKGVGLDYLSNGFHDTTNDDGLKRISGDKFVQRINTETLRFFKDTDPDISIKVADAEITSKDKISHTSFSYLSPSRIDLPRKSISLIEQLDIPDIKSKKNRVHENINDGKDNRKEKHAHIHTAMLSQNLTSRPIASMFDKFGKSKTITDENTSQNAIEELLQDILSEHGSVTIEPIEIEVVQDHEGISTIVGIKKPAFQFNKNFVNLPDPHKEHTPNTQNQKLFEEIENSGKNGFMHALTHGLVKNGTKNKKKSDLHKPTQRTSEHTFSKTKTDPDLISIFDPKKFRVTESKDKSRVISGFAKSVKEEHIKALPNHYKAIMLTNIAHGSVKHEKLNGLRWGSSLEKTEQKPENSFNFEMLKQIERLVGFTKNKKGDFLVRQPIWKVLNQKDYENLVGKEIVCRLIKYENKELGIGTNHGTESHSYDNYFILLPKQTRSTVPTISPAKPITGKDLFDKIRITLQDNFPGLELADKDIKKGNRFTFANLSDKFVVVDTRESVETTTKEDKRTVKVRSKNVTVRSSFAIDAMTLDCQSFSIPTEHLNSNIISSKKFEHILKDENLLKVVSEKQKRNNQPDDTDKCSAFGKFRPNGKICSDR